MAHKHARTAVDRFIDRYGNPLPQSASSAGPTGPVQPSIGTWIVVLIVVFIVAALVAVGIALFASGRMPMPPGPWGGDDRPVEPDWHHDEKWGAEKDDHEWGGKEAVPGPHTERAEDSRWAEGKATAGLFNALLKVLKAENSGQNPGIQSGPAMEDPIIRKELGGDLGELGYFNPNDFLIDIDENAETFQWTIVVRSSHPDGPSGTYYLSSDGKSWIED